MIVDITTQRTAVQPIIIPILRCLPLDTQRQLIFTHNVFLGTSWRDKMSASS